MVLWREGGPETIGTGLPLGELVRRLGEHGAADLSATLFVAVPAYYHDGQRTEVRDAVLAAGFSSVRIVNEPTAVTLAYAESCGSPPERPLVLSVSADGAFDVTLSTLADHGYEVLAANGVAQLGLEMIDNPERLFAAIRPVVDQALTDGDGVKPDTIILGGATSLLRPLGEQIAHAWGLEPVEPPNPEIAAATGAALAAARSGPLVSAEGPAGAPAVGRSGCLGVLAAGFVVVGALAVILIV